jgi:hypothetical protein
VLATRFNRLFTRAHVLNTDLSRVHETYALAAFLAFGLAAIAPLVGWALVMVGVSQTPALLVAVGLIGVGYGLSALAVGRVVGGLAIALVVTSTFAANAPLAGSPTALPGNIGPQIWLFEFPLVVLALVFAASGAYSRDSFSYVEYALGGFVVWSLLSALFGSPPRPTTALWFVIYAAVLWLALSVFIRCVREDVLSLQEALGTFVIAVCAHAAFATVQFLHRGPFGLTVLGETDRFAATTQVVLGPLGTWPAGTSISGLAGGSATLSILLVLALPLALGFAFAARRCGRRLWVGGLAVSLWLAIILRLTAKDASHAAAIIALTVFVAGIVWTTRRRNWGTAGLGWRRVATAAVIVLCASAVILSPSVIIPETTVGAPADVPADSTASSATSTDTATTGTENTKTSGSKAASDKSAQKTTQSSSVFNMGSLSIRLKQYVVAVEIAINQPLFGIGGANFPAVTTEYGLPKHLPMGGTFVLHSVYLAPLAETGIPGFLFYGVAVALVGWAGWQLLSERPTTLTIGLCAALVGYATAAFWISNLRFMNVLPFWLLAGAVVGAVRR